MARVLIFGVPFTGHTNPLYPVIHKLRDMGVEVTVVNDESYRTRLEATGARVIAYPRGSAVSAMTGKVRPTSMPGLAALLMRVANELLPFTQQTIDETQPDCVLHDAIACWAFLALRDRRVPGLALVTTFAFSLRMSNARGTAARRLRVIGQLLGALPSIVYRRLETRITHRIRPLRIFETFMALEERNIVFTSREFQPDSEQFADRCEFVGPTSPNREDSVEFPYELLQSERPAVYISFGTIMPSAALLQTCFQAFATVAAQFVVSLGGALPREALGDAPPNFLIRDYVPQPRLLERVDAFVTHGGMNSVHESLLAGVPMVVVPLQEEEAVVARRVAATGAGRSVGPDPPYGKVRPAELADAVDAVIKDEGYARRAREIGNGLRASGGRDRAAAVVLQCASSRT